jgi:hypothetical protein
MASSHEETAKPFQWLKVGKLTGHQLAKGMPWKVYLTEEDMTRLHEWLRRARRVRKQEVL